MIASNAEEIAQTQATVQETSQQVQILIEEGRTDRAEARRQRQENLARIAQAQAAVQETSQQVQILIEEGKADRAEAQRQRQENASEHAAFRELLESQLLSNLRVSADEIFNP